MAEINNYLNPKGYALCIGINKFQSEKVNELKNCINDVNYWSTFLKDTCSYDVVRSLRDSEATKDAILVGLWCLAAHALPGDIVTITFSTHGVFWGSNKLYTYDRQIAEEEFMIFLRAFKPGVRVNLITDACRSGSFVDKKPVFSLSKSEQNSLEDIFRRKLPHASSQLCDLLSTSIETPLSAHVAHLTSSSDDTDVNDGILVKCTKDLSWRLDYYELGEWRDEMESMFKPIIFDKEKLVNGFLYFCNKSDKIKKALEEQKSKSPFFSIEQYLYFMLSSLANCQKLHDILMTISYTEPSEDGKKPDVYKPFVRNMLNDAKYQFGNMPLLSFHGKKSLAFQYQYAFAKKSPAFQKENI